MYLGESSFLFLCCCFSGSAAAGRWVSKCISFLFMLFKMWHLESFLKEASSFLLGSPLPEQGRERQTQSPARVRSLPPSHMQIRALWWALEDISLNAFQFCVRSAYKTQCDLQGKNKSGKFCGADAVGTERNNSEMVHGQKCCLLKTKAESKSIPSNVYMVLKKIPNQQTNPVPPPKLIHMH